MRKFFSLQLPSPSVKTNETLFSFLSLNQPCERPAAGGSLLHLLNCMLTAFSERRPLKGFMKIYKTPPQRRRKKKLEEDDEDEDLDLNMAATQTRHRHPRHLAKDTHETNSVSCTISGIRVLSFSIENISGIYCF